ncbi:hypothetical protein FRC11_008579, partial [Ceratobasidium sp. 423]
MDTATPTALALALASASAPALASALALGPASVCVINPKVLKQITNHLVGSNYRLVQVEDLGEAGSGPKNGAEPNQPFPDHHPFLVKYIERPYGTHGKRPPKGFHTGDVLGLSCDKFAVLVRITDTALRETQGINMLRTIRNQHPRTLINTVKQKLIKRMPTFHMYEPNGYWPIDCLLLATLKSSKDAHNWQQRQIKINEARKIDKEAQKQELVKKQEAAVVEADTPVQEDAAPPAQVNAEPLAEAWTETNTGDWDASKLQASNGSDDAMDAIVKELSSMLIFITNDDTPMDEADSGEPVLPANLVEPSPPTQVSVATHSAMSEAPPTSDTPHMPATLNPTMDTMQVKLECLK